MGYAVSPLFGLNIQMRNYLKELKERPRINLKKFKEIVLVKEKTNTFSSTSSVYK